MNPGEQIGPYRIEALLGEGGMGAVYRARDTRLDRTVALKVSKAEFGERFEREARAVAALNHPNICTLFDVGPNYLVMEYIEGTPLKGPVPPEKAVEHASQILDALEEAHRKGFTHRDLKPANILAAKQGIKLLDFGLAKRAAPVGPNDATLTQALTGKGQILGTLQYMAPEQLQGKEADARSDVFAFGCVLYELLSGKRAFEGESAASVIAAILEREPAPLEIAPPLGRVIRTCLEKDPDKRFQTAADLKRALAWAMEQQPAVAAKASRWPWLAAAAMLALGLLGGWAISRITDALPIEEQTIHLQVAPPEGGRIAPDSLAVSPDGRSLAYVTLGGKSQLWVRPLDGSDVRALPGPEGAQGAQFPFWSPDGRSLGFASAGNKLWRITLAGGIPQAISDTPQGLFRGGAWLMDGTIVLGSRSGPLLRVPSAGGSPARFTELDAKRGETSHAWPLWIPGSRTILFFIRAARTQDTGMYAVRIDRPAEPVQVVATDGAAIYSAGHLLWRRGTALVAQRFDPERLQLSGEPQPVADPAGSSWFGRLSGAGSPGGVLVYSPANGGEARLTWLDRAGQTTGILGTPEAYESASPLSPDGRAVVVARTTDTGSDLWIREAGRDTRFTFTPGPEGYPVWSPDGRSIVFQSGNDMFRKESNGAAVGEGLAASPNRRFPTSWSRDGRSLLYTELANGTNLDIWVLPVTPEGKPQPGAAPRPYLRTPFNERNGRFSPEPNPRWVAYRSDESGRDEVYVQAFPEPKGKWQISTGGGQNPAWSPDGRELFYVSADGKLMAVKLTVTEDSVHPAAPVALFGITPGNTGFSPFDVAPDGKRFLVQVPVESAAQPIEVIVNWPALLKKSGGR